MPIGCAPKQVESYKVINSLAILCRMWRTVGNSPTLIMELLVHYNICTKNKCISFSYISWPKVWESLLAIWINSMHPFTLPNVAHFLQIGHSRQSGRHEVSFFKQTLEQSLFDCLQLRGVTLQIYTLYF